MSLSQPVSIPPLQRRAVTLTSTGAQVLCYFLTICSDCSYHDEILHQTDPVNDESAFDWDLSDRTDSETQTLPPTRAGSTTLYSGAAVAVKDSLASDGVGQVSLAYSDQHLLQDAIVQTDQRLVFLIRRAGGAGGTRAK